VQKYLSLKLPSRRLNAASPVARHIPRLSTVCAVAVLILCVAPELRAAQGRSTQASPPSSSGPLDEARSSLKHGNTENAIRILSNYLQNRPQDASAHTLIGQAFASAGQNDRAEEEFQMVLKIEPDNSIALAALGELYEQAGKPDQAEPFLARAAKGGVPQIRLEWGAVLAQLHKYKEAQAALAGVSPPADPEHRMVFHRVKASVAVGVGDAHTAAAEMEKALALKPTDNGIIMATAVAELQSKNAKRAVSLASPIYSQTHSPQVGLIVLEAELESHANFHPTLNQLRSTQLDSSDEPAFRQNLAALLISFGEYADATVDLQAAVDAEPSRADLLYNLTLAEFRAGHLDDAAKNAQKCKELGDDADLESLIGDIQEARGNNVEAAQGYQAAIALAPHDEKYRLALAVELIRHNNLDAARLVLKQTQEMQPNSWHAELALGMVEYFSGTDEDATRYLMHAADLAPDPATALKYLGDVQMDRASAPDAAALARLCQYSDSQPQDGHMQYYCGGVLFRRDYVTSDKSHADEILKRLRVAEKDLPKDAEPHCQLGKAYRWLEHWPEALNESKTCVRMDPNSADAHYRLAQIYQHMGQKEQSQSEMKLYENASMKMADENAHRQATIKTFIYTLQNPDQAQDQKSDQTPETPDRK